MTAAAVLAAGGSERMGRPKQLLPWRGRSLVYHAARVAGGSCCDPVWVVLGAARGRIAPELADLDVHALENPEWREGIASSIRVAAAAALRYRPRLDGLLLLPADQPLIDSALLDRLCEVRESCRREMAACAYAGTLGVPALFGHDLLARLAALRGNRGAAGLLRARPEQVATIEWPAGEVDLDTPEAYEAFIAGHD